MNATATTTNPPAAGEAAVADIKKLIHRIEAAGLPLRLKALKQLGEGAPSGGYAIFWGREIAGWTSSLENSAENGRLAWRPGCVAVSMDNEIALFEAVGGSYDAGARGWDFMTSESHLSDIIVTIYERVLLGEEKDGGVASYLSNVLGCYRDAMVRDRKNANAQANGALS